MISIESDTYFTLADMREGMARLKRHGYDAYDLREFVDASAAVYSMSDEDFVKAMKELKAASEEIGLTPYQAHAVWPADDTTEESRAYNFEHYYVRSVIGCGIIGCKNLVVHPLMPFGKGAEPDFNAAIAINEAFFRKLLPIAKENGVTLCLENMPFPNHALNTPESTRRFVDLMADENFAICLDTGHAAVTKTPIGEAVFVCGDKLKAFHIHDNFWALDTHLYPFQGNIPWPEFFAAVRKIGYRGVFSLECSVVRQSAPEEIKEPMMVAFAAIAKYFEREATKKD